MIMYVYTYEWILRNIVRLISIYHIFYILISSEENYSLIS